MVPNYRPSDQRERVCSSVRQHRPGPGPSPGSFDFGGGDGDAVAFLEDLVSGAGLPVDPDQVVLGSSGLQVLIEKLGDGGARFDVDMISEPTAVVVNQ